jgi:hypothetical protein
MSEKQNTNGTDFASVRKDDVLTDSELDIVAGGTSGSDWTSWTRLLAPPIPYPTSSQGLN